MVEKTTLLSIMSLAHKISIMDENIAEDVEFLLTVPEDEYNTNSSFRALEESILNETLSVQPEYVEYILSIIDSLTFIDNNYIRKTFELRKLDGKMTVEILEGLLDDEPVFRTAGHSFDYYHTLSNLTISLGNSPLIQKAIDKVQTI